MTGWGGVLTLFLIPVGGGIPAGVLLARARGIGWPAMELLYFISDVLIAFGVDPMTGRTAAHAAGHGFLSGWTLAITGDMMYFTVIMVSTLWLNSVLGDGTKTMVIILIAMFAVPELIKRWRERRRK